MRKLLSPKNAFLLLPEHEQEFFKTKEILTSKLSVKPFDINLPTILITDASRLNGMGFALIQKEENNNIRLIQCGSKSLTSCQQNYATIEVECLAIFNAVNKCKLFLHGAKHFTGITDHKPLVGIFNKHINDLDNRRLQNLLEKVMGYNFTVSWLAGKHNLIADALSRYPLLNEEPEIKEDKE